MSQTDWPKFMCRMPKDVKRFVAAEARKNASSQNSEIIRSIRERMDRAKAAAGAVSEAKTPAAVHHEAA